MDMVPLGGTAASRYLRSVAAEIAAAYVAETAPRAILLTGSAAEGVGDAFSDLDLIAYYDDDLPSDAQLARAHDLVRAVDFRVRSERADGSYVEEYVVRGVECEMLHTTVATWERLMGIVLDDHAPTSVIQKAIGGLVDGIALAGDDLIDRWKARAATYPDGLARTMVERYLGRLASHSPLWRYEERMAARDATVWRYLMLVALSQSVLGVLAGLNGLYYSPLQLKRVTALVGRMRVAPEGLAARLDGLFALDRASAACEAERIVEETVALVEVHRTGIDTSEVRRAIGARQRPWVPSAE